MSEGRGHNRADGKGGTEIRRFWRILLTGGLLGAGLGMFMYMNSTRRGREVVHEEVASESPLGVRRKASRTIARQARSVRQPVAEAVQSVSRRLGTRRDEE